MQKKKKKSNALLARWKFFLNWCKRAWLYVSKDVMNDSRDVWYIHILKTLNITVRCFLDEQLQSKASALTFSTILAAVPILAMIFAVAKGFGFQHLVESQLFDYFPAQQNVLEHAIGYVDAYLKHAQGGVFIGVGIVLLMWALVSLLSNIEKAFNDIWQIDKGRSIYRKITDYMSLFLILPILMVSSSGVSIFLSTSISESEYFHFLSPLVMNLLEWAPYLLTWIAFTLIYVLVPNTKVKFRSALVSGIICGTAFQWFQFIYISGQVWVSKYNAIYGSFAFVPLLLLWLQLSWLICLLGVVLTYSAQNVVKYEFGETTKNISRKYYDYIALVITSKLAQRFSDGFHPITKEEVADRYDLPYPITSRVIDRLVKINILSVSVGDDDMVRCYQPGMDINQLTVGFLLKALDESGEKEFIPELMSHYRSDWKTLGNIREFSYEEGDRILVKDLCVSDSAKRRK